MSQPFTINIMKTCRICISVCDTGDINIYDPANGDLVGDIYTLYKIKVQLSDSFSSLLCQNCWNKIKSWRKDFTNANHYNIFAQLLSENALNQSLKKDFTSPSSGLFPNLPLTSLENPNVPSHASLNATGSSEPPKLEKICPFCVSSLRFNLRDKSISIVKLCDKHSEPFACLVPNCFTVFPARVNFIKHYRSHKYLLPKEYICSICLDVVTGSRKTISTHHVHAEFKISCCSSILTTMNDLVMHILEKHSIRLLKTNTSKRPLGRSNRITKRRISLKRTRNQPKYVVKDSSETMQSYLPIETWGQYKCPFCDQLCDSVEKFREHSKKKHKFVYVPKDKGIKLCPLCDHNYLIQDYIKHIELCTNTMRIVGNDPSLIQFGCVHCKVIYNNLTPSQFRYHVIYCKSFRQVHLNDTLLHEMCVNCTFRSNDRTACAIHANSKCLHFKLKMQYATKSDETCEIHRRNVGVFDNEDQFVTYSSCHKKNRLALAPYFYLCNICNKGFFSNGQFSGHMTVAGEWCRSTPAWYCEYCVTNFESEELFMEHNNKRLIDLGVYKTSVVKFKIEGNEEEDLKVGDFILTEDYDNMQVENEESKLFVGSSDRDILDNKPLEDLDTSISCEENIRPFQKVEMLTDDED